MTIITTELLPQYDARKSFHGKAKVETDTELGVTSLYSYGTLVAAVFRYMGDNGRAAVYGTYSATTLRHIKEFLKQHGFTAKTKDQILADYTPEGLD